MSNELNVYTSSFAPQLLIQTKDHNHDHEHTSRYRRSKCALPEASETMQGINKIKKNNISLNFNTSQTLLTYILDLEMANNATVYIVWL